MGRMMDTKITRAGIHPAINIARIGDSATEYFIGPEVREPAKVDQVERRESASSPLSPGP